MTREPELYNQLFQRNIKGQAGIKLPKFHIPIGNYKKTGETQVHPYDTTFYYQPFYSNSFCFSSLAYALYEYEEVVSAMIGSTRNKG